MLEALQSIVADPAKSKGVPEEFIDSLDRVDKKTLKKDDTCPICTNEYLSDPHPLVVRLNHCSHKYDLDCIKPWLQVNSTCPMCRVDVLKKKEFDIPSDDEEEFDDMYG